IGVPWTIVMLGIAWVVLTKLVYRPEINELPGGKELIRQEHAKLGRMTTAECRVGWIFAGAIFFGIFVPFIALFGCFVDNVPFLGQINDAQVAMAAAIACFLVPARRARDDRSGGPLLRWSAAKEIPWGLLLLFGGGLSLPAMFTQTGFSQWVGEQVSGLSSMQSWLIIIAVMVVSLVLTELTSNTATAAAFLP